MLKFDPVEEARRNWRRRGGIQPVPGMTSVMRASQIMRGEVDAVLKALGLNYARYEMLMLLSFSRSGTLPLGKIGERLQVHPTSVTNTVDRLTNAGLVRRVAHTDDRRTVLAEITAEGLALAEDATEALRNADLSIRALSEDEVDELTRLIRKIRIAAGDFDPSSVSDQADSEKSGASAARSKRTKTKAPVDAADGAPQPPPSRIT